MKSRVTLSVIALLAAALGCEAASPAPGPAATPRPVAPATRAAAAAPARPSANDALLEWVEAFFAWGEGKVTIETIPQVTFTSGAHLLVAKKAFTADARMNDQAYLVVENGAKTVLVGDVIYDEERAKRPAPMPVRGESDLDGLRGRLKQYLVGAFSLVLDPANDRKGWKAVIVKADTGYGSYPMAGWVKADDGTLLILGRWWDRTRSVAEQRREFVKLTGTPVTGPPDARVTVVEYSDMQCGFCKKRTLDFENLVAKLGKELKIRRYIKSFPLTGAHPWAFRASSAGRCFFDGPGGADLFFRWKSNVYAKQEELSVPQVDAFAMDFAVANDLDEKAFRACYLQAKASEKIHADLAEGWAMRVRSTPTYFIDGVYVSWFGDNVMEEFLRKTYLGGRGLPLPTPVTKTTPAAH
ncbi:MAG TPA: thioredoxin domain-containing protein [Thermoanaerobaculia bacterium]|nr:thioredoxin domain-containing protein [Thermoanaerobaculia bacterium]